MSNEPRNPKAAGAPLALAIILGATIGGMVGQSTIGVLVGTGAGAALAIAVWLVDRRRG